jgi:hypothetical protein
MNAYTETLINEWLSDLSQGQWQLEDSVCNLLTEEGEHYASIQLEENQLLLMFPLSVSVVDEQASLHTKLLLLNNHPEVIGFGTFSLSANTSAIVFSTALALQNLTSQELAEFWERSVNVRNILFQVIQDQENF